MKTWILIGFLLLWFSGWSVSAQPLVQSQWIAVSDTNQQRALPVFRKSFLINRSVRSAKLLITALGLYEASLNDKRVDKDYFTPGFTSYDKRLQYQAYDVKALLSKSNKLDVLLGNGWYRGPFRAGADDQRRYNYGKEAALLAELVITYVDGSVQRIGTDDSWQFADSQVVYSELYNGELQDLRPVQQIWRPVHLLAHRKDHLVKTVAEPVRKQERFKPLRVLGGQVVNFGQNMAGWVRLKVKGRKGDTVKVRHVELLNEAGNFYTANLRSAKAEDIYVLSGNGAEVLEPHFTYHGFRYAQVIGAKIDKENCEAIALYSDLKQTGLFECSDTLLNRLQKNIEWSMKSNFVDIPTDCPQRSERMGWTGDAQVFCRTAGLNRNVMSFYSKYLADLAADQGSNGGVPTSIPDVYGHLNTGPKGGVAGWGDAATIIPWTLYKLYGETAVLRRQYESMKGWVDYMHSQAKNNLWQAKGYGDWYALGDSTSLHFIDQAFYVHSTALLLNTASVLHKNADVAKYSALLDTIKKAFVQTYGAFDTKATQTQTAYVLALAFDLLPSHHRSAIAERLADKIKVNGDKLATGFLGTPYLLPVLSRFGYTNLAYRLLLQKACPSWLYPVTKGATTIWERWDAIRPDGTIQPTSFNHFAYGAVGQWFYENIAGIQAAAPGYRSILIKPEVGSSLTWAKASYRCPYGLIRSAWKRVGKRIVFDIEVPVTATIVLPDNSVRKVKAGKYQYKI